MENAITLGVSQTHWGFVGLVAVMGAVVGFFKSDELEVSKKLKVALVGAVVACLLLGGIATVLALFSGGSSE